MPFHHVKLASNDVDAMQAIIGERQGWRIEMKPRTAEPFSGELSIRNGSIFVAIRNRYTSDLEARSDACPDNLSLVMVEAGAAHPGGTFLNSGDPCDRSRIALVDPRRVNSLLFFGRSDTTHFTLPLEELRRRALHLTGDLGPSLTEAICISRTEAGLGHIVASMFAKVNMCFDAREEGLISDFTVRQMEETALLSLLDMISQVAPARSIRAQGIEHKTVRRAIDIVKLSSGPMTVGELAECLGVTARALQIGFLKHLGIAPHEFLKQARLAAVRQELLASEGGSIHAIARRWGFSNATRFKADYFAAFGPEAWSGRHKK
ncbi:AraC family transcriptional regulator [Labrys monachus]|uniref:AraC-like DNA-binding protein n=1 Tax=Labrys monachus TaxID=217067 RepID=A0ABU0FG89_9HYPH|nr:helix-turn-helix domain-containing protein [Labrys monachus]MDQ0393481.1 AraC-like DNA-binding protein [Labrys monachus]